MHGATRGDRREINRGFIEFYDKGEIFCIVRIQRRCARQTTQAILQATGSVERRSMENYVPDDYESGFDWHPDEVQEANGVALLLASSAYLTLADAYLRQVGPDGLVLMEDIEKRLSASLQRFVTETPHGSARPDIILAAARKLRVLLQSGRVMPSASHELN